jgi:Sec-independent protein translocase protein TatA
MLLPLAFFDDLFGFQGILILAILGVLLYGERLPEVAAKVGKQLMHLKKHWQGIRTEIESVAFDTKHAVDRSMDRSYETIREEATAPKFEPPPAEPVASGSAAEPHFSLAAPPADNS